MKPHDFRAAHYAEFTELDARFVKGVQDHLERGVVCIPQSFSNPVFDFAIVTRIRPPLVPQENRHPNVSTPSSASRRLPVSRFSPVCADTVSEAPLTSQTPTSSDRQGTLAFSRFDSPTQSSMSKVTVRTAVSAVIPFSYDLRSHDNAPLIKKAAIRLRIDFLNTTINMLHSKADDKLSAVITAIQDSGDFHVDAIGIYFVSPFEFYNVDPRKPLQVTDTHLLSGDASHIGTRLNWLSLNQTTFTGYCQTYTSQSVTDSASGHFRGFARDKTCGFSKHIYFIWCDFQAVFFVLMNELLFAQVVSQKCECCCCFECCSF